jgi:hypothetical protein
LLDDVTMLTVIGFTKPELKAFRTRVAALGASAAAPLRSRAKAKAKGKDATAETAKDASPAAAAAEPAPSSPKKSAKKSEAAAARPEIQGAARPSASEAAPAKESVESFLESAGLSRHISSMTEFGFVDVGMFGDKELLDDETMLTVIGFTKPELKAFRTRAGAILGSASATKALKAQPKANTAEPGETAPPPKTKPKKKAREAAGVEL